MRVVDHDPVGGAAELDQRIGQEELAVEAPEPGGTLEEQHPRITQHGRRGLDLACLAIDDGLMGRGVVLHLLARLEVVSPGGDLRLLADAVAAAERGQGRIGDLGALAPEFLMDPDQIAFAGGQ